MKAFSSLLIAIFATVVLAGCNTISGFGKDVQKVGQAVSNASGK